MITYFLFDVDGEHMAHQTCDAIIVYPHTIVVRKGETTTAIATSEVNTDGNMLWIDERGHLWDAVSIYSPHSESVERSPAPLGHSWGSLAAQALAVAACIAVAAYALWMGMGS